MRHEFPVAVKRAALARSGGRCEATGPRWGHEPGKRCEALLAQAGVQYDHWPLGAHAEGSATIENCNATCPACNQWAANHTDKKVEAKIKRVRRKHNLDPDTRRPKPPMRSRGFDKTRRKRMDGTIVRR